MLIIEASGTALSTPVAAEVIALSSQGNYNDQNRMHLGDLVLGEESLDQHQHESCDQDYLPEHLSTQPATNDSISFSLFSSKVVFILDENSGYSLCEFHST